MYMENDRYRGTFFRSNNGPITQELAYTGDMAVLLNIIILCATYLNII